MRERWAENAITPLVSKTAGVATLEQVRFYRLLTNMSLGCIYRTWDSFQLPVFDQYEPALLTETLQAEFLAPS